jgi:hypothetical protein
LALILSLVGCAATWMVDDCGGANFTRLQDAIDNASAGDPIPVYGSIYHEDVNVEKQLTRYEVELYELPVIPDKEKRLL